MKYNSYENENKEEADQYLYIREHARKSVFFLSTGCITDTRSCIYARKSVRIQELTNRGTCMCLVKALLSSYNSLHSGFSCLIKWKRTELREMCKEKELAPSVPI
jgi:hypothetical protein